MLVLFVVVCLLCCAVVCVFVFVVIMLIVCVTCSRACLCVCCFWLPLLCVPVWLCFGSFYTVFVCCLFLCCKVCLWFALVLYLCVLF